MPLINIYATDSYYTCSRSPRGERGLKIVLVVVIIKELGRSPRGERGLKIATDLQTYLPQVAPHVGSVD